MKILVACEESQAVTIELRKLGHEAYSCDIIECSDVQGKADKHVEFDSAEADAADTVSPLLLLCAEGNGRLWKIHCDRCPVGRICKQKEQPWHLRKERRF